MIFTPEFEQSSGLLNDYVFSMPTDSIGFEFFYINTGIIEETCDCGPWYNLGCWLTCAFVGIYSEYIEIFGNIILNVGIDETISHLYSDAIGPNGINLGLNMAGPMKAVLNASIDVDNGNGNGNGNGSGSGCASSPLGADGQSAPFAGLLFLSFLVYRERRKKYRTPIG